MIETTVNYETLTGISLPPKTVVGYRQNGDPIYNIAGGDGRVEVGDDADDDDDDDATAEDDSEDADDEWVPPSKEEFDRLLAAKQKADSEAAARKRFLREAGFDPKTGKAIAKPKLNLDLDDEDDSEEEEARQSAVERKGESKARNNQAFERQLQREIEKTERRIKDEATVLLSAVPNALNDAGWNGKSLERIIRLLDLDEIHVDSDGEIDGLAEQVTELQKDFPHFFRRTRMKEAAKEVADTKTVGGGRKTAPAAETNLNWTERLKAELYKR